MMHYNDFNTVNNLIEQLHSLETKLYYAKGYYEEMKEKGCFKMKFYCNGFSEEAEFSVSLLEPFIENLKNRIEYQKSLIKNYGVTFE